MRHLSHSLKEADIFKWQNVYLHLLFVKFFFFVYPITFLFCPTKIVT